MPLLSVATVAERLALSVKQVRRLISAGELPHVKLGHRSVRVEEEDLAAFVAARRSTRQTA